MLAVTAGTGRMQDVLKAVWSHLLPPLRGQEPASLSEGNASKAWRLDPPKQTSRSVRESLLSDLSYRLEPNVHRLTGIRFQFRPDSAELVIQTQERGSSPSFLAGNIGSKALLLSLGTVRTG
ncbi:hypothetical protein N6H14_28775 [Paenibacillus sp. CC-CFT747]|nr:hypothetical protein N6H14_28775 [Paenibacillus sp. CC-CFT747]